MAFDMNMIFGRLAELAPEWDPCPILQQLNTQTGGVVPGMEQGAAQAAMGPTSGSWDFLNPAGLPPTGTPTPPPLGVDPAKFQTGPLAGMPNGTAPVPVPQAPQGVAPLTLQQMAALKAMMPPGTDQTPRFAPAVAPQGGRGAISMQGLTVPGAVAPQRPSFSQLMAGRR